VSLFAELKRRNVLRLAAAYIVTAWLIIQVVETIFPAFGFGDAAIRIAVIILAIGLVPVLVLAWAFELTPEGLKLDKDVDRSRSITAQTGKRLDRMIMVVLALGLGYFAVDKFVLDPARDNTREQEIAEAARQQGRDEATLEYDAKGRRDGPPMVAVLPFASTGLGDESEFFSTGVHDDLLTQLAQLQSLRVISRTSVLEYKDTARNIREIGKALGADAVLEGGVQIAGDRIRINAQLIDAQDDEHLWAETYDRELLPANIFEIQSEIARAIADALHATLSDRDSRTLTAIPTENMAAYRAYHQAMDLRNNTIRGLYSQPYVEYLEEAVTLDPAFTRALVELVGFIAWTNLSQHDPESIKRAEELLEQIHGVSPDSADYLIAQAYYTYYILRDYDLAHEVISRAEEMRPSDPDLIELKAWIERRQGDWSAMIESLQRARTLDPRTPRRVFPLINNLIADHRYDEASVESEDYGLRDYWSNYFYTLLRLREHRDPGRLAEEMKALHAEFDDTAMPDNLWPILIANREYAAAKELADMNVEDATEQGETPTTNVSGWQRYQIMSHWFLEHDESLAELLEAARATLERGRDADSRFSDPSQMLSMALVLAAEGNRDETERTVRRWLRAVETHWPPRVYRRDLACQILGMAGATAAAVDCIRVGLIDPSYVMPFMEPYLPFYDSIRDEPEFVELLAELGDADS
jgi:TolB-like protein